MGNFLIIICIVLGVVALDFALVAAVLKGICWAFGFAFTWKLAFGVWLLLCLLQWTIFGRRNKE